VTYERDGLTLIVTASNQRVADNLERLFAFWPDDDPPRTSESRVREIEAKVKAVKEGRS
jgi:hypothetical protein